jgi:uncharacterized membrane protein SirB2
VRQPPQRASRTNWTAPAAWLTVKVVLLVPYIALGYLALRGKTRRGRLASLAGAALVFGFIYTVARAHHPLGLLA